MTTITLPRPEATADDYFDLPSALAALESGAPVQFPPIEIVHFGGLSFCLNFRDDPIQGCLRRGEFYEQSELRELAKLVPKGAHILDVGANIGNHAVYFAARMKAERVVVIEPNPLALAPLLGNILINRLDKVIDTGALGVGLGAESAGGFSMRRHDRNLGATKMRPGNGPLKIHAGDSLFEDEQFDLIKIDVEGMEMQVLAGLDRTISRCRPLMLIEVDHGNDAAFRAWCQAHDYAILRTARVTQKNTNHVAGPAAAPAVPFADIGANH